jgi:hypothetical protein
MLLLALLVLQFEFILSFPIDSYNNHYYILNEDSSQPGNKLSAYLSDKEVSQRNGEPSAAFRQLGAHMAGPEHLLLL